MFKTFKAASIIALSILVLVISASAAEFEAYDNRVDIEADFVDSTVIQMALECAVTREQGRATILVNQAWEEDAFEAYSYYLFDTMAFWTYEKPEVYNYTRDANLTVDIGQDSFKLMVNVSNDDGYDLETAYEQKRYSEDQAQAVYDQLVADGVLNLEASELEKARVLLDWVCENVTYINDGSNSVHTAYSAFAFGYAICDGYTSTYNLLLKAAGIECRGVKGDANGCHEWTMAKLDGQWLNVDSTWCDNDDGTVNLQYFAVTNEQISDTHTPY